MKTKHIVENDKVIHRLFEQQVKSTPDLIAIIFEDQSLSYSELNNLSDKLAERILKFGADKEMLIGISMERSPAQVISILGVWKAGCAYVPLDPSYPKERLAFIMEDAKLELILTLEKGGENQNDSILENICFQLSDQPRTKKEAKKAKYSDNMIKSTDLAYVIYTSGSTGLPKGVLVEHAGLINLVENQKLNFSFGPTSRVLQFASINFDTSLWEILLGICSGATLVMAPSDSILPGDDLIATINRYSITHFTAPPSVLAILDPSSCPSLEVVVSGGEALKLKTAQIWAAHKDFYNAYGPTEATIEVSFAKIEPHTTKITIGHPLKNMALYILNEQGERLQDGEVGELYIAGLGLARGYLNRPELTDEKFIQNPFIKGGKMYKTGDMARYLPDGQIEFIGRIDKQVKIRGYRIECGEIENTLLSLKGLKDCVVIDRNVGEQIFLCAYYVSSEAMSAEHLRGHLQKTLPEFMIPTRFMAMASLPLTPNGKVDINALPEPELIVNSETIYSPPASDLEKSIACIWGNLLGLKENQIGIHDHFFALGGDSIRSAQLANKLNQANHTSISVKDIFTRPTIFQLAEYINEQTVSDFTKIPKASPQQYFPLSSAQKRIYYHSLRNGLDSVLYNIQAVYELTGKIEHSRLNAAFQKVVDHIDILRTTFKEKNGNLAQYVAKQVEVEVPCEWVSEDQLESIIDNWGKEPFVLECAPLMRLKLVETLHGKQFLFMDSHHIIMDGLSFEPFFNALSKAYDGLEIELGDIQYKDYAAWQQSESQQKIQMESGIYWKNMFKNGIPLLDLPFDFKPAANRTFAGETLYFELSNEAVAAINNYSRLRNTTPYMIGFSAFAVLISKYAIQSDIVIGTASSGRNHAQLEDLIGMFVNTLAISVNVDENKSFDDFIKDIKDLLLDSFAHDNYPYDELIQSLKKGGQPSPMLSVIFSMLPQDDLFPLGGQHLHPKKIRGNGLSKFDISFSGTVGTHGISFEVEYSTELFMRETMEKLFSRFEQILLKALANPKMLIEDIDILLEEELLLLQKWNDTKETYPTDKLPYELFEEKVIENPNEPALFFEDISLSYQELNEKANRLAWYLRNIGVKQETLVGISMNRSPEVIISILAIWKAGGAYVPLDPAYPIDRLVFMIEDSEISFLIVDEGSKQIMIDASSGNSVNIISISEIKFELDLLPLISPAKIALPENLAYIIYTSGSTGRPKGVLIEHRSVCNLAFAQRKLFDVDTSSKVLLFASLNFDASVWEILMALCNGAALVLAEKKDLMPGQGLADTFNRYKVTHCILSPTALGQMEPQQVPHLQTIISGGEALPLSLAQKWASAKRMVNAYGPTEATVGSSSSNFSVGEKQVTIGRPLSNYQIHILDKHLKPLPPGLAGEIHIAGDGLARGYLNRPELTAEKFIANPFQPGTRIYKTGDLGRWLHNGDVEFLGRIDHQVKIRGFRIECGEIESVLLSMDGIQEVAVVDKTDQKGQKYLCAYYVSKEEITLQELKAHLAGSLPEYMIPSRFMRLKALPLAPSGKVDRKALPEPEGKIYSGITYLAPTNETEKKLSDLWSEILALDSNAIGINDDFFLLGGDSIRCVQLSGRIRQIFVKNISIKEIFDQPTIKQQALLIEGQEEVSQEEIPIAENLDYFPAASAQKRVYLHNLLLGPNSAIYNMPIILKLSDNIDHRKLQKAFQAVVDNNDIFRTSFEMKGELLVQKIANNVKATVTFQKVTEVQLKEIFGSWGKTPFVLDSTPLLRMELLETFTGQQYLLVDSHHIIMDGLSYAPFFKALSQAYNGNALKEHLLGYKDYSTWQQSPQQKNNQAQHGEYWLKMYESGIPVLELPTDFSVPAIRTFSGNAVHFHLSKEITTRLKQFNAQSGTTPFMTLYSVFALLISKYSQQDEVVVGITSSGRNHPQLSEMIGMFVNTLAIRNSIPGEQSFSKYLETTKSLLLKCFSNDSFPYEELIRMLNKKKRTNSLINVLFTLIQEGEYASLEACELQPMDVVSQRTAKFDITFSAIERKEEFFFEIEYATELFHQQTIEKLFARFESILNQVLNQPDMLVEDVKILIEEERKLINQWNDTRTNYPSEKTIHGLFEEQVYRDPFQKALYFQDRQMTYDQLNRRSNKLARTLRRLKARPNEIIGLMAERSFEMMVGIFAILKSGAAYLPLDPSLPKERLGFMLEDSSSRIIVSMGQLVDAIPDSFRGTFVNLDDSSFYDANDNNLENINIPSDLAYIIYTSGSTGQPKGVMIEHHSVLNRIDWIQSHYPLGIGHVHLQKTPITFDVSVSELFWWSFYGASLAILEPGAHKYPDLITKAIARYKVNIIHFVPSMLTAFIDFLGSVKDLGVLSSLRQLYASGEALAAHQVKALYSYVEEPFRITNLYGPTEATVEVSWFDCNRGVDYRTIPIGKPIQNTELYVLNKKGEVQPVNMPGELCIGGVQVARGYLNREALSADRFVPNPFRENEKMYRTGDLVRWLQNGDIEFLGRIDHQVKIRGYRIELGEIEHVLLSLGNINDAVVIDRTDGKGSKYLCAYYIAENEIHVKEFRTHLALSLPDYMIPARFVRLEHFPLTPSGKTDRKLLPEPEELVTTGTVYIPPASEQDKILLGIWGNVLNLDPAHISIRDNFFELGGDSIRSVQISSKVSEIWNKIISLKDIFEHPTIEQLSSFISKGKEEFIIQLPKAQSESFYVASSAQKRIYLHQQLEGERSTLYNMPVAFRWYGHLDIKRLEAALQSVLSKYDILRTGFEIKDGKLVQIIKENVYLEVEHDSADESQMAAYINNWVQPFDLHNPPLVRLKVLSTNSGAKYLLMDTHHIIMDGMSYGPLFAALSQSYDGFQLEKPSFQYKDYAVWQQSEAQKIEQATHREYWMEMYNTGVPALEFPTDFPDTGSTSFEGGRIQFSLTKETLAELRLLGTKSQTTPFMILYSTFVLLICKYAQQQEVVVGTVTSGRNHPQLSGLIGMMVNTLAIRSKVDREQTFLELLAHNRKLLLESYLHDSFPYEELARMVKSRKSGKSLFDVVFTLLSTDEWTAPANVTLEEIEIAGIEKAKFNLAFNGKDLGDKILFDVTYSTGLFKESSIKLLVRRFEEVLKQVLKNPSRRLFDIGILLSEEETQLQKWNDTKKSYPDDQTIRSLFESQVNLNPDNIALIFEDQKFSYRVLNEKANQLANYLIKEGVKAEKMVGVCMERSPELIISFLAIWKAGGAYIPLDPTYPVDRLNYMITDAEIGIILTDNECHRIVEEASGDHSVEISTIISLEKELFELSTENPEAELRPNNLAYVIYTSGSTGWPKGVQIEHHCACNLVYALKAEIPANSSSIVLQFASTSFDASVLEILMALCNGAALVVAKKKQLMPGPDLTATLNRYKVTHCLLSPTALGQLEPANLPYLQTVISGGEALPLSIAQKWAESKVMINAYGPTEATVAATFAEMGIETEEVTIGRPFSNYQIYILNQEGALLPPGLPGEIYISGAGLARGYLNRPQLTDEKFVHNPFENGKKMYKTGDLGRWVQNGEIEFLGRIDYQVKVRGYRIECGEIENALLEMEDVREVAVVDKLDSNSQKYLCAYYVSESEKTTTALRGFLSKTLPDFMIPSYFESLNRLPLTPNGKIDRKLLKDKAISFTTREQTIVPRNMTEVQLCRIWQLILNVPEVGIFDNFFEWGGDSIKAIPLIDKIQEVFNIRIPVHAIFQNPTVEMLANYLGSIKNDTSIFDSHLIPLQPDGSRPPLFFVPGIEGKCYYVFELAKSIGKLQPLYGFQSCGLEPDEKALESIEEIASFNIGLLKQVQPSGPYLLAGHSLGGWVVFEMARQLKANGDEVTFLGLLDSFSPNLISKLGRKPKISKDQDLENLILVIERLSSYYRVEINIDSLRDSLGKCPQSERLQMVHQLAVDLHLIPIAFSSKELLQWSNLMGTYARIVYRPTVLDQNLTLFRAHEQGYDIEKLPSCLGWSALSKRKVIEIEVPGDHISMMQQPHVNLLTKALIQQIKEAELKNSAKYTYNDMLSEVFIHPRSIK